MSRYFITGTDTGVGKTFVTCALARRARDLGQKPLAWKPVETGVDGPIGEDQAALVVAAGGWQDGDARGLYRFRLAAAPLPAAKAEQAVVDVAKVKLVFDQLKGTADVVLVEGAGGLRVPLAESSEGTIDMAALALLLRLPLIVVARAGLGTINHSLLTIEAAEHDGLGVSALILSRRPEDDRDLALNNAAEIRRRWNGPIVILDEDPSVLDFLLEDETTSSS